MSSSSARRILAASLALAALSLPLAPRAHAGDEPVLTATGGGAVITGEPQGYRLWDQTPECSENGVSSQDITDMGAVTEFADDFVVPLGVSWLLRRVLVDGVYQQGTQGPANSVNVVIYEDAAGLPGAAVATFDDLTPIAGLADGNFLLELPTVLALASGRYWVSVQAVMPFDNQGQWFWQARNVATELERVFRNPDDFFGTGCTEFHHVSDCPGTTLGGPDHCFALIGEVCEGGADLDIDKTASSSRVPVGERLTFILRVENLGPEDAVDVDVEDLIPDEFDIVSVHEPSGWTSTVIGNLVKVEKDLLLAGEQAVILIEVRALRARQAVVNEAHVESDTLDCDLENNEARVTVRIHGLSDPGVPTLSTLGLALLALLMGATLLRVARGSA